MHAHVQWVSKWRDELGKEWQLITVPARREKQNEKKRKRKRESIVRKSQILSSDLPAVRFTSFS